MTGIRRWAAPVLAAIWPAVAWAPVLFFGGVTVLQWVLIVGTMTPLAAWVATEHPNATPWDRSAIWRVTAVVMAGIAAVGIYGIVAR